MTAVAKNIEKAEEEVKDKMVERLDTTTTCEYGKVVMSYISGAVQRYV